MYNFADKSPINQIDLLGEASVEFEQSAAHFTPQQRRAISKDVANSIDFAYLHFLDANAIAQKFNRKSAPACCKKLYSDLGRAFSHIADEFYEMSGYEGTTFRIRYDPNPSEIAQGTAAYVYAHNPFRARDIYIVQFNGSLEDSIFHELTHLTADTSDLVSVDVDSASKYAESAYYLQQVYDPRPGKDFGQLAYFALLPVLAREFNDPGGLKFIEGQCDALNIITKP